MSYSAFGFVFKLVLPFCFEGAIGGSQESDSVELLRSRLACRNKLRLYRVNPNREYLCAGGRNSQSFDISMETRRGGSGEVANDHFRSMSLFVYVRKYVVCNLS
jgi:hypothetical protein